MSLEQELIAGLKSEFKLRLLTESYTRIAKCLSMLNDEQIGKRPNENSNSIANLILHLTGNVKQWIGYGLGEETNVRQRDLEFTSRPPFDTLLMLRNLESTIQQAVNVIENLPEHKWLEKRIIQTYEVNGIEIVVHVIEHFSYHTGQIALLTKLMLNRDLGFYDNMNL